MKVKIIAPYGCRTDSLDERGWVNMKEASTVSDALKLIHCSKLKAKLLLVSVNGERSDFSRSLCEGDVIGFFFPAAGG